jgi:hypothetical protein
MKIRRRSALPVVAAAFSVVWAASCVPGGKPEQEPSLDFAALQKDVIAKLSGYAEITPGSKLPNREAPENKQAARAYLEAVWKGLGLEVQKHDYSAEGENL